MGYLPVFEVFSDLGDVKECFNAGGTKTAGGQEEFQIFDKHVNALKPPTCNHASFALTVVDAGGLILRQRKKKFQGPGLKIPSRMWGSAAGG